MKKTDTKVRHITPSGGNVFADLGHSQEDANKLKLKSQLMMEIRQWIKENNMKQEEAAEILRVSRPRISNLMTGKIDKFTIDALVDMVERSGHHVTLEVA
jgi:predicted XRE-type DNA-binding protein